MVDVAIIGGGPAASTLGAYLSRAGVSNALFEKAVHPRPHVGESMVPATTRIFEEIGFLETLNRSGFVRKYGAAWHPPSRKASLFIKFAEFPQQGIDQEYTYHVDRSRFDLLLLQHAEAMGTEVHQGVPVREVLLEGDKAVGVRIEVAGRSQVVEAEVVVDASGRTTLLGRQLGLKKPDALFNQFAVHAWFEGVDRGDAVTADDIHIHFLPVPRGWVWQIPLGDDLTSVGVVAERGEFRRGKEDHAAWFDRLCASAPDIRHAMRAARRVTEFTVEADYSYSMDRFCGDGWLLVGDAARFVDPIFSSGVCVAMYSAKFAAEQILPCLRAGDVRRQALLGYEQRLLKGTAIWYEFICLYYKLLPLFTKFIEDPTYRLQVLELLQGEVYDREAVPVLDAMRSYIRAVEANENHVLRPALDPSIPVG